ncbi:flavin reductase family protein [Thermoflavimicrobium daqui]|uniref:Flavin reductase like domain-containing protein n=1 Tax=Thermoflavimicrobium daqui TaxID=2137476 RepID=A0A364K0B1_9BACL|nr:flavin reductase family protein [Thermoflavimicrobium daqui]RAL20651.1 hypothetical protein DL897_17920 [Thermoflavimicrobium daqui]
MKEKISESFIQTIYPKILYYGTPVLLLTTLNEDNSTNISPMSSSWALGYSIVLGMSSTSKAYENICRHQECVINLPDSSLWTNVEKIALLTGKKPIPSFKEEMGFQFEKDKFGVSGLTPTLSNLVSPMRIQECPIQMEAKVVDIRSLKQTPSLVAVETEVVHVHVHSDIILRDNYIDPSKWSPLIYNFRHYFGLGEELGKTSRSET